MTKGLIVLLTLTFTLSTSLSCSQRPKRASNKGGEGHGVGQSPVKSPAEPAANETGDIAPPSPGLDLVWKRYRAFEHGLTQGLGLKKEDFCLELGQHSCIDKTHLTVLGGNEPYNAGQYERAQAPTVLTAIAVDRIVLTACTQRLELDRKAGASALVFKHFPLTGQTPAADALSAQTTELYQRILARNPDPQELKAISNVSMQGVTNDKLALMLCYAIASSSENILL